MLTNAVYLLFLPCDHLMNLLVLLVSFIKKYNLDASWKLVSANFQGSTAAHASL